MTETPEEKLAEDWYDRKSALMEETLGKEHDMVMHAMIPFAVGGGLDLYYFPNGIAGTAVATKELSELPGQGSSNDVYRTYELVMFTRHAVADWIDDYRYVGPSALAEADRVIQQEIKIESHDPDLLRMEKIIHFMRTRLVDDHPTTVLARRSGDRYLPFVMSKRFGSKERRVIKAAVMSLFEC